MKLLLCVSSLKDIENFMQAYSVTLQQNASLKFLYSTTIQNHEVDILETGVDVYQASYKVTKIISRQKYHLALKISFANAYKEGIEIASVLNVINEKPGDFGMFSEGEWKDNYDFGLVKKEDEPHVRGGYVNMNTSYMNVFLPFKKVVSVTVNHYADKNSFHLKREKYKADCETGDGLGFVYPCLFEKQNFYQLCVIERNLSTDEENFDAAKKVMNETLIDLLSKL